MNSPTFTLKEIMRVLSIENMKHLYEQKNITFDDKKQFFSTLEKDWREAKEEILKNVSYYPQKLNKVPSIDVILNRTCHSIYGIVHFTEIGQSYTDLVSNTMKPEDNWLFEQNLGSIFSTPKNSIEIPDHLLISNKSILFETFYYGQTIPDNLPNHFFQKYLQKEAYQEYLELLSEKCIFLLNKPVEVWAEMHILPPSIEIELQEREGKYQENQARSAYQAEFMKTWKKGQDKNILVGASHAEEIKHFLLQGVKDNKIIDLAQSHVELLETNPQKFSWLVKKSMIRSTTISSIGLLSGTLYSTYNMIKELKNKTSTSSYFFPQL